jgi:hypothetical protein
MYVEFSDMLSKLLGGRSFDVRLELSRRDDGVQLIRLVAGSAGSASMRRGQVYDYGAVLFVRQVMSSARLSEFLIQLKPGEPIPFRVPGVCDEIVGTWSATERHYDWQRLARGQSYAFMKRPYPSDIYLSDLDVDRTEAPRDVGTLNARGLPYFSALIPAEMYFLFGGGISVSSPVRRVLQLAIDDRRSWIEKIVVSNEGLAVSIGGHVTKAHEIKLVGTNPELVQVLRAREAGAIALRGMPRELHVYLSKDDQIVDERYVSEQYAGYAPTEGVMYERDEELSIEGIIRLRGEGLHHDYKVTVTDRILHTICAFANTEGGTVLVGVDDEGEVLGVKDRDKERLRLEDLIESNVVGTVERSYSFPRLPDRNGVEVDVLVVTVQVAPHKPVAVREDKVEKYYVRRDGSNRLMRREDFARMVEAAENQVATASVDPHY